MFKVQEFTSQHGSMFISTMLMIVAIIDIILLQSGTEAQTSTELFRASTCGSAISQASPANQAIWEAILPQAHFWNFFANRSAEKLDILMVDVDMHSWELLLNQVVGLQNSGSRLAGNVHAIAYDDATCGNLTSNGISCYYNVHWNNQLKGMYKRQTGRNAEMLHMIMMGRMITTAVTLCEGYNVFLSDTDVVFFPRPDPVRI